MSTMPMSSYPAPRCGLYVEGGVASYPCSLPLEHKGPCYAIEVANSRVRREKWEKENPEEVEKAKQALAEPEASTEPDPSSPFIEDQPDPVAVANAPGPAEPEPALTFVADDFSDLGPSSVSLTNHAMVALEEIIDALVEADLDLSREEVSDDPVAAVQRLAEAYSELLLDQPPYG